MNAAIIGAGLIGKKRALSLPKGVKLEVVCDLSEERLKTFSQEFGCNTESDWKNVFQKYKIDALFICTPNHLVAPIAQEAIARGVHVLIEKPGARHLKDFSKIYNAHKKNPVVVMFGYNHRYHPGIVLSKKLTASNKYGKILFIRAKYGHGGRLGYEKEWRFDKAISGGGHLIDQGTHLIDLVNFFYGTAPYMYGKKETLFWKTPLEDSAFFLLGKKGFVANLSTTCLEWKNVFCFEIMTEKAKIQIDGLGRSYGTEKVTLYTMSPKMGPPTIKEFEFPGEDSSWKKENLEFFKRIKNKDLSDRSLQDARYVLEIIDKIYKQR